MLPQTQEGTYDRQPPLTIEVPHSVPLLLDDLICSYVLSVLDVSSVQIDVDGVGAKLQYHASKGVSIVANPSILTRKRLLLLAGLGLSPAALA